jgi:molybdopterin biosynthesis enzyme
MCVLPGDPLALLVGFEALARPAIRRLAGNARITRHAVRVTAAMQIEHRPGRLEFIPVALTDGPDGTLASPVGRHGPAMLSGTALAGGLALIGPAEGTVAAGETIRVEILGA